jgi:hypothetical protein
MSKPPEQSDPSRGATLQQPDLPEAEIPTRRTPRVVMPTQHPSAQENTDGGIANPSAAEIDETPTQRIRRIKTATQHPSTHEKPDERPADLADADTDETPTQRIRRIKTPTQQPPDPRPADSADAEKDETPTQRIRRIKTRTQAPSTREKTDERAADTAAADAENVDPAHDRSEAADTVETPLVLAAGGGGRGSAADTEESDEQKLEPIAAHTEKVDLAPDGPEDATTVETPPVLAAVSGERHPAAETKKSDDEKLEPPAASTEKVDVAAPDPESDSLEEPPARPLVGAAADPFPRRQRQEVGPARRRNSAGKKRLLSAGLTAIALSALLAGALFFSGRDGGKLTAQPVATGTGSSTMPSKPTSEASTGSTETEKDESTIQVKGLAASARPFETVRIEGKYPSGADTYLRVQRWDEGEWLAFPIPTKTDQSGQFTAYVELGQPGRYPLRVLDPDSGTTSKTFVILIER